LHLKEDQFKYLEREELVKMHLLVEDKGGEGEL
jgi:hypothetical protein